MRGATVTVHCKRCKEPFTARVADRKRGWGRFCGKRCKAIFQTYGSGSYVPRPQVDNDDEHRDAQEIADRGY